MKKNILLLSCVLVALFAQGCAHIMGKPNQSLPIITSPSEASVQIKDENGQEVFNGNSPAVVSLVKSAGPYQGGKVYIVTISKPGYRTKIIPILPITNNYFNFGNILTEFVGYFIDPLYGGMFDMSPELIDVKLSKTD